MKAFIFSSRYRVVLAALLLATGAGLVSSCKDYLTGEPVTFSTIEATFSTVSGATSAVLGAYDPLSGDNTYGTRLSMYYPVDTDELIGSSGTFDTGRRGIARYKAFSSNTEIINPWNNLYQGVERANLCIANIPKMPCTLAAPAPTRPPCTASTASRWPCGRSTTTS